MKQALSFLVALMLSGCAGMSTTWVLQLRMIYETPEPAAAAVSPAKPASSAL